jgi:hypothetical protein
MVSISTAAIGRAPGRSMRVFGLQLAAALAACWGAGCHSSPAPVARRVHFPHKDVLHCNIQLTGPATAESYLSMAERELSVQGSRYFDTAPHQVPVYELRFAFHDGMQRLAVVTYRRTDDHDPEFAHIQTIVYDDVDMRARRKAQR